MPVPIEPEAPPTFSAPLFTIDWDTYCDDEPIILGIPYIITYPEFPRIVLPRSTYNLTTPRIIYPRPRNTYVSQHTAWQRPTTFSQWKLRNGSPRNK